MQQPIAERLRRTANAMNRCECNAIDLCHSATALDAKKLLSDCSEAMNKASRALFTACQHADTEARKETYFSAMVACEKAIASIK